MSFKADKEGVDAVIEQWLSDNNVTVLIGNAENQERLNLPIMTQEYEYFPHSGISTVAPEFHWRFTYIDDQSDYLKTNELMESFICLNFQSINKSIESITKVEFVVNGTRPTLGWEIRVI